MPSESAADAKTFRRSWADMNSDDSSMGAQLPSLTRRKDEHGSSSVQLPKSGKQGPTNFSLICDDSYAPGGRSNNAEAENRRDGLNDAMGSVRISESRGKKAAGVPSSDFSCFGFLLPKSEETYDADNTKSRMAGASSEESKLGKRLLSAVAGGQSDFSVMMGMHPESSQPSKFRKIDENMEDVSGRREPVNSFMPTSPIAPTRRTMNDGANKAKLLSNKRIQLSSNQPSMSPTNMDSSTGSDPEWEARFQQREKQIELGKATKGYVGYLKAIPKSKRSQADPQTPNGREPCSKRQFDGKLHKWRKGLHQYDPDSMMS